MAWLERVTLRGDSVVLEPLSVDHHDELCAAVRDGRLWELWYTSVPEPGEMDREIERRLALEAQGSMLPFAVVSLPDDSAVGMTTYMNCDHEHKRVEIGSTWYAARVQRTRLNTECKLMLLTHAFESLDCIAVEFRTHFFNRQSRAGIERLGAKLDGVLRNHQRASDGRLRDTCVYSIIASEWPTVRAHLRYELDKPRS